MTYPEWFDRHALFFGFASEPERAMLASWCEHFQGACGFAADEVAAAGEVLKRDPPRFRADHFKALQDAVWERRRREAECREYAAAAEEERGRCVNCNNAGLVVVPHLAVVRRQTPRWYTMAVLCTCGAGRWLTTRTRPDRMKLDEYTAEVPGWRDLLREHDEDLRRRREVEAGAGLLQREARALDEALGMIRRRAASGREGVS